MNGETKKRVPEISEIRWRRPDEINLSTVRTYLVSDGEDGCAKVMNSATITSGMQKIFRIAELPDAPKCPVAPDLEWEDYNPEGHYLTGHLYLLWWGTGVNSMKLSVGQSIRTNFTHQPDKTAYLGELIETEEGLHPLKGMEEQHER